MSARPRAQQLLAALLPAPLPVLVLLPVLLPPLRMSRRGARPVCHLQKVRGWSAWDRGSQHIDSTTSLAAGTQHMQATVLVSACAACQPLGASLT